MNPSAELATGLSAGVPGALGVFYVLLLALMLVAWWKIFVKMGEPGWKAIIPFYNIWVLVARLGKPRSWFWILLVGSILIGLLAVWTQAETAAQQAAGTYMSGALIFGSLLLFVLAVVVFIYEIKIYHALSRGFGHGVGFTLGLILLSIIFVPILAFGSSRFRPKG